MGSTAVPGLAAKPVIDLDIVIQSRSEVPLMVTRLAELGYEHRGNLFLAEYGFSAAALASIRRANET